MTDSKEWCDGDWRWRSSSKPFAGAESGSPGRALEAGKRGSPGRPVQAGIRGKRLIQGSGFILPVSHRAYADSVIPQCIPTEPCGYPEGKGDEVTKCW